MKWKIDGVDRDTGEPRQVWVDAQTREQANMQAGDLGIVVAKAVEDNGVQRVQVHAQRDHPLMVQLTSQQVRMLRRNTQMDIAVGVFLGLLLWAIFAFVLVFVFWGVVIAAIAGSAGGGY